MTGPYGAPVPFGTALDTYRKCARPGCEWSVPGALLCRDHGGRTALPGVEFRTDQYGRAEYRPTVDGPAVPATRATG